MHNLDTCEVTAVGDELDGEHESLELDVSQLQPHGLEMSSSNLGLVITGTDPRAVQNQHRVVAPGWRHVPCCSKLQTTQRHIVSV